MTAHRTPEGICLMMTEEEALRVENFLASRAGFNHCGVPRMTKDEQWQAYLATDELFSQLRIARAPRAEGPGDECN